jgi:hypothetical protein
MEVNSTQASLLIRKEKYQVLGVSLNIQISINICLDLSDKRYLLEQ